MKKTIKKNGTGRQNLEKRHSQELPRLFEVDEVAWLEQSRDLIRQKRWQDLDFPHLAEYLDDMANRDKREVKSRLKTLLAHLLKWQYQPASRAVSWDVTITNQREELVDIFSSATLKNHALNILPQVYELAVKQAVKETGLAREAFPSGCPFSLETLLKESLEGES